MSIKVGLLGTIYLSQVKEEGTFQTNTIELSRPPDCDFMGHGYAKYSALHFPLLHNASIQ